VVIAASGALTGLLEATIAILLIALLYYALIILTTFKKGMLERGWKIISWGIIVLVVAQLTLALSEYVSVLGDLYQVGLAMDAIGVFLTVLGLKWHCDVWRAGNEKSHTQDRIEKTTV